VGINALTRLSPIPRSASHLTLQNYFQEQACLGSVGTEQGGGEGGVTLQSREKVDNQLGEYLELIS